MKALWIPALAFFLFSIMAHAEDTKQSLRREINESVSWASFGMDEIIFLLKPEPSDSLIVKTVNEKSICAKIGEAHGYLYKAEPIIFRAFYAHEAQLTAQEIEKLATVFKADAVLMSLCSVDEWRNHFNATKIGDGEFTYDSVLVGANALKAIVESSQISSGKIISD